MQVETAFPERGVNGGEPLVPPLQRCVLQSPLPDQLPRLLPSEATDTGVDGAKTGGVAVRVERKLLGIHAPRVEGEIGTRSIDEAVSLGKEDA